MMEISLAIIAAAFVCLIIYALIVLRSVHRILTVIETLLPKTPQQQKGIQSLFCTMALLGNRLSKWAGAEKAKCCCPSCQTAEQAHESTDIPKEHLDILEWLALGVDLWLTRHKRR
jgi:hypothetical protein